MEGAQRQVVVFAGLPGTGKSTLADLVAARMNAPAFAGDWLMEALRPYGVFAEMGRHAFLGIYHNLLDALIARQLALGQSAVVDCLVTDRIADHWARRARRHQARLYVVECVCSDRDLHRSRVEGRRRTIPGWHEDGWESVERIRREFPPLSSADLTIDAVNPLPDNASLVMSHIGC